MISKKKISRVSSKNYTRHHACINYVQYVQYRTVLYSMYGTVLYQCLPPIPFQIVSNIPYCVGKIQWGNCFGPLVTDDDVVVTIYGTGLLKVAQFGNSLFCNEMKLLPVAYFFVACAMHAAAVEPQTIVCNSDSEGTWAIGIMYGPDWFHLSAPIDTYNSTRSCLRNPIITCKEIEKTGMKVGFVADPFLYIPSNNSSKWYLFFEVKNNNWDNSLRGRRGQIGVSVSIDEVLSVRHIVVTAARLNCVYSTTGIDVELSRNCSARQLPYFISFCFRV